MLDLVPLWAAILALAVFMYVLLDGFDLGVGMLFLLRRDSGERNLMINSVAPVWDFNETWLVLRLIFRGVAFEFREVIGARKWLWDGAFGVDSLIATFA